MGFLTQAWTFQWVLSVMDWEKSDGSSSDWERNECDRVKELEMVVWKGEIVLG